MILLYSCGLYEPREEEYLTYYTKGNPSLQKFISARYECIKENRLEESQYNYGYDTKVETKRTAVYCDDFEMCLGAKGYKHAWLTARNRMKILDDYNVFFDYQFKPLTCRKSDEDGFKTR